MTASNRFERLVEEWLESTAPGRIPGNLHPAVIDAARRTPQRRGGLGFLRQPQMSAPAGIAVAAAFAGLIIGAAAGISLAPRTSSGAAAQSSSPAPGTAASPDVVDQASRDYGLAVAHICSRAEDQLAALGDVAIDGPSDTWDLEAVAVWTETLVGIGDEAIADLRALPAPPGKAEALRMYYYAIERPIDVLRYVPQEARSGDAAMVEILFRLRIHMTHLADAYLEAESSDPLAAQLEYCPFRLGA
jgi:hypothetical protein